MTPQAGDLAVAGPQEIQLACPVIEANYLAKKRLRESKLLTVDTAPRAGQKWQIQSAYYNFPHATKFDGSVFTGKKLEYTFGIRMLIDGVEVAQQRLLESALSNEPEEETTPLNALGSLEPFAPAILHAGGSLAFEYYIEISATSAPTINTGEGAFIVVTYNLNHRAPSPR